MSKSKELGIELNIDSIQSSDNMKKRRKIYDILQIIVLYGVTYSTLNCFSSGVQLSIQMEGINVISVFFCILSYVIVTYIKAYKNVLRVVGSIVILICFVCRETIMEGIKAILNAYVVLYDEYYQVSSTYLQLTTTDSEQAILAVLLLLSGLLSMSFAICIIKNQKGFYYSLLSVPFVFCSYVVGTLPDLAPFLLYCATSIAIFSSCSVITKESMKKKGKKYERRMDAYVVKTKQESLVFCIILLLLVLSTVFLTEEKYKGLNLIEQKKSLQMELKKISTGEVWKGSIFESMWGEHRLVARGGLSNGIIGNSKGVTFDNTTELEVITSDKPTKETIYLRGYIGQQYSQNKWNRLSTSSQKQLSNLKNNYSIEAVDSVSANLSHLMLLWEGQVSPIQKISVQNVGEAKDYFYVPYHQTQNAFIDSNGFFQVPSMNAFESITYKYEELFMDRQRIEVYTQVKEQNETNIKLIEAWLGCSIDEYHTGHISQIAKECMNNILSIRYLENGRIQVEGIGKESEEKKPYFLTDLVDLCTYKEFIESTIKIRNQFNFIEEYETFVYENYLELPDHQLESVKALVNGWKEKGGKEKNQTDDFYNSCILKIKSYFKEHTSYNLNPGAVPKGKEAVDYFLFENPNGYCMYYATAAAVMLREFGIPARYVEGFIVTEGDLKDGVYESGERISKIKDSNAHAWVEIYKKGAGWVPVEVTPAYESNDIIQIPSQNQDSTMPMNPLKPPQTRPSVSKAPTKAPVVSNKPQSQTTTESKIEDKEKTDRPGIFFLQIVLYSIGSFLLVTGILIVIRVVINQRRRKIMMEENTSKKAILQYRILQKLLLHRKIVYQDKESFTVYAKKIQKQFPCFTEEECQKYIYLILKARYHYEWLTKEEGEFATLFYEKLIQEFYKKTGKCKRLYYQYMKFF